MLPFDLKMGQVSSNYMRFFKETQVIYRQTHIVADPLLSLCRKQHSVPASQQQGRNTREGAWLLPCRTLGVPG